MPPKRKRDNNRTMSINSSTLGATHLVFPPPPLSPLPPYPSLSTRMPTPSTDASYDVNSMQQETTQNDSQKKKKNVRGRTRGVGTSRIIAMTKSKLTVKVKPGELHAYCGNASKLANEIGIIVRAYAPLALKGWSKVSDADKEVIYARLQEKFDLDFELQPHLRELVDKSCSDRYKNFRHSLHVHYKKVLENDENPLENRPETVRSQADWEWVCALFESPEWKKSSEANKCNRSNVPYSHKAGPKSYIAHRADMISDEIDELGHIALFKKMHWSASDGWCNTEAESRYNMMIELQEQQQQILEESGYVDSKVDEVAICAQVLGVKPGYKPGIGPIPRKRSSSQSSMSQHEMQIQQQFLDLQEKLEKQSENYETKHEEMVDQLKKQTEEMERQRELIDRQRDLIDRMFSQISQTSQHSSGCPLPP